MDLSSAQQNEPATFASSLLSWLKWRYSPIAEMYSSQDAENTIKQLNFPSVAHFLRPFFIFTEPVSMRGVNENALPPTSLHIRLFPLERVREADSNIRSAFFAKTLSELGEQEFNNFEKNLFPILRKVAAQGAMDDDLASGEVPLNSLMGKDHAHFAQVRDSLTKSQKAIEAAEASGVDPSTITQPPLDAPKSFPGHGVASSFSSSITNSTDAAEVAFLKTAETLLKTSYQEWFATFIRDYNSAVRFSHFDPVDYPVAQVFVVTSSYLNQPSHPDCDIVRALQQMVEKSKILTNPSNPQSKWPKWTPITIDRTNLCRLVFILHDSNNAEVTEKTVESVRGRILSEICSPSGGCYVLKVPNLKRRTRENFAAPSNSVEHSLITRPWLNANSLHLFDDYANAVEKVQRQLENENLVTNDTSLEAAIAKVDSSTPNVAAALAPMQGLLVNKSDFDELSKGVNSALRITLFPFLDRRLRTMSSFVSENRQSALGKFASSLFSSDKNKMPSIVKDKDNPEPRYRHDCLEMQMRRCGDMCMALQDFNSALNFYRMARDEWKETLPSREFNRPLMGSTKEAIAVCMYLTGKLILPPSAMELRRDPDAARFEHARDEYRAAKCHNYTFRVTQLLVQMCRESKRPSHERGILQITPGAQVQFMLPLYQAIMHEQLALFKLVSSPPLPILPATKKWLKNYINDGSSAQLLQALTMRPRSFALSMYEAAKKYHETNLGKHSLRCALAAWHILRYRCVRSGSFPVLVADVALFIAKRFILDSEPLMAAGFIVFVVQSAGWSDLPVSIQNYAVKQLRECLIRASQRFGTVTKKNKRHVLIHSTLPSFAYSLISVSSHGIFQDASTKSFLEGGSISSLETKKDMEVECERLYDDVRSEYTEASSVLNVPRNLHTYKTSFCRPHTERKVGLSYQSHHHDDLFVPKSTDTRPPAYFYTTSQNETLQITIGIKNQRFPCALRKVRLLFIELNKNDRNENTAGSDDNASTSEQPEALDRTRASSSTITASASATTSKNSGNLFPGDSAAAQQISDMLVGAGSRRVQHQDIQVASSGLDVVQLRAQDSDSFAPAAPTSFTLPISFEKRGTFAVVGFRYELELPTGLTTTGEQQRSSSPPASSTTILASSLGPIQHNCLFPCLQLSFNLYHEGVYVDSLSQAMPFQCSEELMMSHAGVVFSGGLPATHPSYLYVHVRAPVPTISMEFIPPLPTACRNGELFSTQLVIKNTSTEVAADHARVYISECCGHLFAVDVKPSSLSSSSTTTTTTTSGTTTESSWKQNPANFGDSADWSRVVPSDNHPEQNVGGLLRLSIPQLAPKEEFTFNCIFRAQSSDFLRTSSSSSNNNSNSSLPLTTPDVASVVLFSSWTMPKKYLIGGKECPAISGALIRLGRLYRRVLILPSISITPKCVSLVTTKPLQQITDGKKENVTFEEEINNVANNKSTMKAPQVALAIEIRSEKRASSTSSSSSGGISSKNTPDSSFFVIDDIAIISAGWRVKCLSVPTSGESSPSKQSKDGKNNNNNKKNKKTSSSLSLQQKASLASRSVSNTINWTCAAMLTRDSEKVFSWEDSELIPKVPLVSLDGEESDSDDDDTSSSSSSSDSDETSSNSDSSSSSSSSESSTSESDSSVVKKAKIVKKLALKQTQKQIQKEEKQKRKPKKGHLDLSFSSLLHFCIHAPICGTGVLGRPAKISDDLAFYADGNEKKDKSKKNKGGGGNASPLSPEGGQSPLTGGGGGGGPEISSKDTSPAFVQTPHTLDRSSARNNSNNPADQKQQQKHSNFEQAFPAHSPSYERELVCLPDKFSPNEKCPLVLRVSWREVSQHRNFDNSKRYKTLRRGVSFDVVKVSGGDLSGCDALFRFRERLFEEAEYRREHDGATVPLSPFSFLFGLFSNNQHPPGSEAEKLQHSLSVEAKLLKASLSENNPLSIPKIQCALSAPRTRVFSSFSQSGFAAEVPIEVAIANQSPFPVFVSVYSTPRYAGNGVGLPVVFSGRHAYTDIYLKPAESKSNLKFVALALSLGILDVASSCFSFEVVNALVAPSTRKSAIYSTGGFSSQGSTSAASSASSSSSNLLVTSSGPATIGYTAFSTVQALRAKAAAVKDTPPPIIVFGNVGGLTHSSLVRVEALRNKPSSSSSFDQQQRQQQLNKTSSRRVDPTSNLSKEEQNNNNDNDNDDENNKGMNNNNNLFNLSFAGRGFEDVMKSVTIVENTNNNYIDNSNNNTSSSELVDATTTIVIRKRGERSSSRVCRASDGSTFIPIKIEGVALTTSLKTALSSSNNNVNEEDSSVKIKEKQNEVSTSTATTTPLKKNIENNNIDVDSPHSGTMNSSTSLVNNNNNNNGKQQIETGASFVPSTSAPAISEADVLGVSPSNENATQEEEGREQVVMISEEEKEKAIEKEIDQQKSLSSSGNAIALTTTQNNNNYNTSSGDKIIIKSREQQQQLMQNELLDADDEATALSSVIPPHVPETATTENQQAETLVHIKSSSESSSQKISTSNIAEFVGQGTTTAKPRKNRFESSSSSSASSSPKNEVTAERNNHENLDDKQQQQQQQQAQQPTISKTDEGGSNMGSKSNSKRVSGQATPRAIVKKNVFATSSDEDDNEDKKDPLSKKSVSSSTPPKTSSVTSPTTAKPKKHKFGTSSDDDK